MNKEEYIERAEKWREENAARLSLLDDWHSRRIAGVGGSEIATIMGENPYHTAHELWLEKTGKMPAFEGNAATIMGQILEPAVAAWYERETGNAVEIDTTHYRAENAPWLCGNIDRRIIGGGVLECKTSNASDPYAAGWGDGNQYDPFSRALIVEDHKVPRYYELQVRQYMLLTGAMFADLAVIFKSLQHGNPFRVYRIYQDPEDVKRMISAAHDFMQKVFDDVEPEMTAEEIAKIHAKDTPRHACADVDAVTVERLSEVKRQIKALEEEEKALENEIKAMLLDCDTGMAFGRPVVTWKSQSKTSFDSASFKKDRPDIWNAYQKTTSVRYLRLKSKKGDE